MKKNERVVQAASRYGACGNYPQWKCRQLSPRLANHNCAAARFFGPMSATPDASALLLALLGQAPGLLPADAAAFAARCNQPVYLRRGELLVPPGQPEQRLYLVRQGLLRI